LNFYINLTFIPVFHPDGEMNWLKIPKNAFSGNGKRYKYEARIAELERMLGQLHTKNELFKKAFAMTQKKFNSKIKVRA